MPRLVKQVFVALFSFSRSSATKCMSLNNEETCMIRPTPNNLNPVELNHYPFMTNLGKCSGSCNCAENLSTKACVPNKTKSLNVKVFNMIANKNEAKSLVKHISCDCKC